MIPILKKKKKHIKPDKPILNPQETNSLPRNPRSQTKSELPLVESTPLPAPSAPLSDKISLALPRSTAHLMETMEKPWGIRLTLLDGE